MGDSDYYGSFPRTIYRADRSVDCHVCGTVHPGNPVFDTAFPGEMAGRINI